MFSSVISIALSCMLAATPAYQEAFGEDYTKALEFQKKHKAHFEMVSRRFKTEARFLKSIIFPELIRYSYFRNMFETETLEWLYVSGGSKSADFSIGHFQMKPSFVEELEACVSSVESLREEYSFITLYESGSSLRSQRLERLKDLSWQLVYLACFFEVAEQRFIAEKFSSDDEKLRFYCAAYNAGFTNDAATIRIRMKQKTFPYGAAYGTEQHSYSDIAVDYYQHYSAD
jgi:hypothetical protein